MDACILYRKPLSAKAYQGAGLVSAAFLFEQPPFVLRSDPPENPRFGRISLTESWRCEMGAFSR